MLMGVIYKAQCLLPDKEWRMSRNHLDIDSDDDGIADIIEAEWS